MSTPIYTFAACSDKGTVRQNNEDNFFIQGQAPMPTAASDHYSTFSANLSEGVAAVFDGMGGEAYGASASSLLARLLASNPQAVLRAGDRAVPQYVERANTLVCEMQKEKKARIGSTMTIASVTSDSVTVYNLGDSPAYLFSGSSLKKLSRDHTVAQQLVNLGILSPEQAASDNRRHQLTQHIGVDPSEMALSAHNSGAFPFGPGDCLLLCSDGVTEGLSESDIAKILSAGTTAERLASTIVDCAIRGGSRDNVTAVVVKAAGAPYDHAYEAEPTIDNGINPVFASSEKKKLSNVKTAILWTLCILLSFGIGMLLPLILELL